jgi:hypothetical protein
VSDDGTLSYNVFDESPENQIVIKEQQMQKVTFHMMNANNNSCLLNISYDTITFLEESFGIYGALEKLTLSMYTLCDSIVCLNK